MKKTIRTVLVFWFLAVLIGPAEAQGQEQSCNVQIVSPSGDDKVAETEQVKGTGNIPVGTYLWIFVHRKGLALWWPQGGGPATITKGGWEVMATFGVERDNGHQFEIAAAGSD